MHKSRRGGATGTVVGSSSTPVARIKRRPGQTGRTPGSQVSPRTCSTRRSTRSPALGVHASTVEGWRQDALAGVEQALRRGTGKTAAELEYAEARRQRGGADRGGGGQVIALPRRPRYTAAEVVLNRIQEVLARDTATAWEQGLGDPEGLRVSRKRVHAIMRPRARARPCAAASSPRDGWDEQCTGK